MKLITSPGEKLQKHFIFGNTKKAEKIISKKRTECIKPFSSFHEETFSLIGALKTSYLEEAIYILKKLDSLEADFFINEGEFSEFFYEYWKPAKSPEKIEVDNLVLSIANKYFGVDVFFSQLLADQNIPHKNINLDKVYFVLDLIVQNNMHNKRRESIFFLKGLCLLAEYKPQILKSALSKYKEEAEKALKYHSNSDEAKLILQFIHNLKASQKVA